MVSRNSDVSLVIRAKTEGEKAVAALGDVLERVFAGARGGATDVAALGKDLASLDKAFAAISGKADGAASAFDRQTRALADAKQQLRDVAGAAADFERNIDTVQRRIVDTVMSGGDQTALIATLRQLQSEQEKLDGRSSQLRRTIDSLEAGITGSRSSLQALGSTVSAVEAAQGEARREIDATTAALVRQTAAVRDNAAAEARASAAQSFFNNKFAPGLVNGPATSNGASTEALIRQFQQLDAEAGRVRATLDPLTAAVQRYQDKIAETQRLVLGGHLGADELAEQERELRVALQATLQQIGYVNAAEMDRVRKGIEAIRELSRAERAYANILAERANIDMALERNTGAGAMPATDLGASFSALKEREAALAERRRLLEQGEAEMQRDAIARNTGDGRSAATANGATFSALAARATQEAAEEARLATRAYEMFEDRVRKGATALREAEEAAERDAVDVQRLREKLDPLAATLGKLNGELERYRDLASRGKLTTDELRQAEMRLADEAQQARLALERVGDAAGGKGEKGKIGLFGLKPYELQNLSYQINDIVTQLASGTSLTQTLGQQGGQIVQLFPRVAGQLLGAFKNPAVLAFVAVVSAIALGFKEAADQAQRLRDFSSTLAFRNDGDSYNPQQLATQAKALEDLGAKAEDANAAIKEFVNAGLNPDLLNQFTAAAQAASKALGTDLKSAAKEVAEAFSGGFDAIAKLDDKLNFLTASERAHIEELFNEGNAQAARTEALNAYSRQAQAAADKQRGPWGDAAKSLTKAWDALISYIANSVPIKAAIVALDLLAESVKGVGDAIASALGDEPAKLTGGAAQAAKIAQVQAQIKKLEGEIAQYEAAIKAGSPISGTLQRLVDQSKVQLATAQANLKTLESNAPDTIADDPDGSKAKARTERLADLDVEERLQKLRKRGQDAGLNRVDSRERERLAGELAFRREMKSTGDAIIAGRLREAAVAEETAETDKQNDAARKKALSEREREIRQFESRVVGAEGGTAKNPFSSAKGYGQFTEGTFLDQFAKVQPALARQLDRAQILALRGNERIAKGVIDNYARENARFLESFGAKVTAGNLYLAHFLGATGAKAVLTAPSDRPVDTILRRLPNSDAVLSGNKSYLRTDGGKGRYRTAGELQAFIGNRVGDTGAAQSDAQVALNDLLEDAKNRQDQFNLAIRHGAEDRQRSIDGLRAEVGLFGPALIAEQRRQFIAQATLDLKQKVEDANKNLKPGEAEVTVTPEQTAEVEALAAKLFDAQHAAELLRATLSDQQRPIDNLEEQARLLKDQADYLRSVGDYNGAEQIERQLDGLQPKLEQAYSALIEFYRALTPEQRVQLGIVDEQQLDNIIDKLNQAGQATRQWGRIAGLSGRDVAQAFASSASSTFVSFINKVAEGKNVFKALGQSVREFAANFVASIAQMIIQLLAYAAAVSILRVLGVPVPGASVGQFHEGGVVGQGGGTKRVAAPAWFAGAVRYHTGGFAGFKPNEVPAILEVGEEVLTTSDPRHRANGGGAVSQPSTPQNVTTILVSDPAAALQAALATPVGERVLIQHVADNRSKFREVLS